MRCFFSSLSHLLLLPFLCAHIYAVPDDDDEVKRCSSFPWRFHGAYVAEESGKLEWEIKNRTENFLNHVGEKENAC